MKKVLFLLLVIFLLTGCSNGVIGCSGCVYSHFTDVKKAGDKLEKYEKNYKKIKNEVFIGTKIDKNQKITNGYVCAKEKDTVFCLEGNVDGSKYEANKKILDKVYDKKHCDEITGKDSKYYSCSDKNGVTISNKGVVYVGISKSNQCYAYPNGNMFCYDGLIGK